MEFSKIFFILITVGSALGGGESNCGNLESEFAALLQVFEGVFDRLVKNVNSTVTSWPYIANSAIENYICSADATIYIFAKGISQISGVDIDYILGIFDGTINEPFLEPLDCINAEIISYYSLVQNITTNLVPEWESLVQKSPINESTPCTTVLQIQTPYYQRDIEVVTKMANNGAIFNSIGKLSLYLDFAKLLGKCGANVLSNNIAEVLNINASIVNEFFANQSISVPPPLSCVKGLISSYSDTIYSIYNIANDSIVGKSPPSNCEPFFSDFMIFRDIWFKYLNELRNFAIYQSVAYPELTPFFTANFLCEIDAMVMFAANATSYYSDVDSEIIYNILQGTASPPFVAPLDCIESKLLFMRDQISLLVNSIIPGLLSASINSTSDTSTCNKTYQAITPYVGKLVTLMNNKGLIMTNATIDFQSISIDDLFLEAFTTVIDCLPNLVGKYVGAALNANSASITAYVNGNRSSLPYPFNCVKIVINILRSILNQALVNFATDSAANVVSAPKIPPFRG